MEQKQFCDNKSKRIIWLDISMILGCFGFLYIEYIGYPLLWQFELACVVVMFVSWGYCYKVHEITIKRISDNNIVFTLVGVLYLFICLIYNNDVNIHEERFGIQWLFVVSSVLGVLWIVSLSQRLQANRFIIYIGQHSLIYFTFQGFLLLTIRKMLKIAGLTQYALLCLCSLVIGAVILYVVS